MYLVLLSYVTERIKEARMRSLVCAFVFRTQQSQIFRVEARLLLLHEGSMIFRRNAYACLAYTVP